MEKTTDEIMDLIEDPLTYLKFRAKEFLTKSFQEYCDYHSEEISHFDLTKEESDLLKNGCHQILTGKGKSEEEYLDNLGMAGCDLLLKILLCKVDSRQNYLAINKEISVEKIVVSDLRFFLGGTFSLYNRINVVEDAHIQKERRIKDSLKRKIIDFLYAQPNQTIGNRFNGLSVTSYLDLLNEFVPGIDRIEKGLLLPVSMELEKEGIIKLDFEPDREKPTKITLTDKAILEYYHK